MILRRLAPYGLVACAGAALVLFAPRIGPLFAGGALARLSAAQESILTLRSERDAALSALTLSEARREQDVAEARQDAQETARRCDARVERARRDGAAIAEIINPEPTYDPQGCPVRELVPAGQLRGVFDPD